MNRGSRPSCRAKKRVDNCAGVFKVPPDDMKKNPFIPALIGVLAVLTMFGAWAIWNTYVFSKKSRLIQAQTVYINNTRMLMEGLVKNSIEYSRKNPSIDPVLTSIGISPADARAATKPATP